MPKTYLTLKDRQKAEKKKKHAKENLLLSAFMKLAICRKIGYDYISSITNLSRPTIIKIVNHPELATVTQLRAVCDAANIPLAIVVAEPEG